MKKSLLLLLAAFATLAASAQTKVEIEGIWYNLTSETQQAEVTYKGDSGWDYDEYSGSITIPATVTYEDVEYSVTSIGGYAFWGCSSLTAITIPEGVTSIGERAFNNCSSLTDVTIPEGVTSINSETFYGCSSLTTITLPEGVTSIGWSAFSDCSSLTSITIPEGVTTIGAHAFAYCSSLTAITLPEGVTSIGERAFRNCSNLTAIVLPKSVSRISSNAFANCSELLDVYCYAEKVPSAYSDTFNGSYIEYATLHVLASALEAYKTTSPWSSFGTIVSLTDEDMSIEQLTNDNSQQTIYDLRGRRVEKAEKGIYIVNGKKTVIK